MASNAGGTAAGRRAAVTLVLVFVGLIGLLMAAGGVFILVRQSQMEDWPTVPGKIVFSDTQSRLSSNAKGGSTTVYAADVRYAYAVDGRDLEGNRVGAVVSWSSSIDSALEVASRYPLGLPVTVHYEPGNPEHSVLAPEEGGWMGWLLVGIGLSDALILGIGAAVRARKLRPPLPDVFDPGARDIVRPSL